jgi:hypothetical protein
MTDIFRRKKSPFLAKLLIRLCHIFQRALVGELGMIRTQTGKRSRPESGRSARDAFYDATP